MHSQPLRLPWHWGAFSSSMFEQMGKERYYGALCEDLLLVTWLMGLLTKAPTFRIKMVSKRSCGEPHFPSLLLDTVSVSSLGEENI